MPAVHTFVMETVYQLSIAFFTAVFGLHSHLFKYRIKLFRLQHSNDSREIISCCTLVLISEIVCLINTGII